MSKVTGSQNGVFTQNSKCQNAENYLVLINNFVYLENN